MNLLPEAPSPSNHDPLYNIGVVTRMTGISMATLRAWERRYDFPEAGRTAGGHRLYSESDIMRLRWVKARIEEGMQTAQAIQALRHQEDASTAPASAPERLSPEVLGESQHGAHQLYREQLFSALSQRSLEKADGVLAEALALYMPEEVITHIVGPVMADIGEAWLNNQVTVATEHLGTNYLRQRLLMWMVSGPPPMATPPIVLACAPGEWHEGSLLMLGALLRRQRYPVAYLGQSVPLDDLASFVRDIKPAVVVVVAMTAETASTLSEWPAHLPEAATGGKPVICYGGRIFSQEPAWRDRMPGVYLGGTLAQGVQTLDNLLKPTR